MVQHVVFLFSQPRAGSTLLQRMLASHSQIVSVSETWLLLPQVISLQPRRMVAEYNHTIGQIAINDFIKELEKGQEDYYTCLRDFTMDLYSRIDTQKQDATYFLEKTPRYYLIINEIAEIFPDAKFIFLFRNPLSVMSSVINSWHSGKLEFGMHYADIFQAPHLLTEGYKNYADRSVRIEFEKLVTNPAESLETILTFLDLGYEEEIITSYQQTKFRRMKESEYKYNSVDRDTITEWEQTFNTKYRIKFIANYIDKLGPESMQIMGIDYYDLKDRIRSIELKAPSKGGFRDRISQCKDLLELTLEWPFFRRRFNQRIQEKLIQQYYQ